MKNRWNTVLNVLCNCKVRKWLKLAQNTPENCCERASNTSSGLSCLCCRCGCAETLIYPSFRRTYWAENISILAERAVDPSHGSSRENNKDPWFPVGISNEGSDALEGKREVPSRRRKMTTTRLFIEPKRATHVQIIILVTRTELWL